jgi:DNA-binding response OmpR family regulator
MSTSSEILLVDSDRSRAERRAHALSERGFGTRTAADIAAALAEAPAQLMICATELSDGTALELMAGLAKRGRSCPTILTAQRAELADCQAALRAGAREFLVMPFGLEQLCEAAERLHPAAALPSARASEQLRLSYTADIENNARAVRELLAFLITRGFACATRARIAGATAEVLENVARHAYPEQDGKFRLEARLVGRILRVEVCDDGVGFDVVRVAAGVLNEPLRSGLARARSLAEEVTFWSHPGQGTRVVLEFSSSSVVFADDRGVDLSDLDYLEPVLARRVLLALTAAEVEPQFHFSPALAVCVGRLLSAPRLTATDLSCARRSA